MKLRTELHLPPSPLTIDHGDKIITIGSCFSHEIGERLQYHGFELLSSPFGTVYNPYSILQLLRYTLGLEEVDFRRAQEYQGVWSHPDFHSSFNTLNFETLKSRILDVIIRCRTFMQQTKHLFITLGTSIVYQEKTSNHIVSNCHKLPAAQFVKTELSHAACTDYLNQIITLLQQNTSVLNIIFTISPVRHIKDGLIENSRSKSRLIIAVADLIFTHKNTHYFPAYEWVIDDLRDYRFYSDDLIHPSSQAVDYIWQKFEEYYFTNDTRQNALEVAEVRRAMAHRPFNTNSTQHQLFIEKTHHKIEILKSKFPWLDL
jgi:hypothetical protein